MTMWRFGFLPVLLVMTSNLEFSNLHFAMNFKKSIVFLFENKYM
jgi:hypothetical protein